MSFSRSFLIRLAPCLLAAAVGALLSGCASTRARSVTKEPASAPLRTVSHVDLRRYMGDWRVIANIPYFGEKNCVDSIESYALRADGKIDNHFTYRKKSFSAPQKQMTALAWVTNHKTNAEWQVRFFGLITVDYLVIDLDPEYRWAVLGYPGRKYGWILAREKTLPPRTYQAILQRLKTQGYDPARFRKVPQLPSQIGDLH
ncbi:MAG: lipocalin family protein [Chthoniobacter sp.]|uniref:lipocalin family protein n=1 Tax=Chthoniobacter sp. TaxID=2510640 RepID=UPI0032A32597